MSRDTTVIPFRQPEAIDDPLTEVAREGPRRMLAQVLIAGGVDATLPLDELLKRLGIRLARRGVTHHLAPSSLVGSVRVRGAQDDRGERVFSFRYFRPLQPNSAAELARSPGVPLSTKPRGHTPDSRAEFFAGHRNATAPPFFAPRPRQAMIGARTPRRRRKGEISTEVLGRTFGFTHVWGKSRLGKNVVRQVTAKNRYARALAAVTAWCRVNRHQSVRDQHAHLTAMMRGRYAYYGITGNFRRLRVRPGTLSRIA
jgi:hypothetical protein